MNIMRKYFIVLMFVCLLPISAMAEQITVAGAANVQFTLDELKAEFTKETGIGVKTVIGSSGKLTSQIENGAPFDVFMSADVDYPKRLYKDGVTAGEPKIYAYGALVLWTFKEIDLSQGVTVLNDGMVKKVAIASPKVAPYGRQTVNAMKYYHLYPNIESKLVYGESISQVNQFITVQAVDIGFTAKSIVLSANMNNKGHWIDVDPQSYDPIAQGVVVLKYAQPKHSKEASAFYDFLFSGTAQGILKKYGYKLP